MKWLVHVYAIAGMIKSSCFTVNSVCDPDFIA